MDAAAWSKEFAITSVTRADLVAAGFKKKVVKMLTDEEMKEIAAAIEDFYCDHGYWEDVQNCTNRILAQKAADKE